MKLLCDHMLGSLAKWLRIFGFDTLYPDANTTDDTVLMRAKKENRLLISRDKELVLRGKKAEIKVLYLHTTNLTEQLTQVISLLKIDTTQVLTRCTLCNTLLCPVEKKDIRTPLPPKVFDTKNDFWHCPSCDKYYWMGTHYDNMRKKINTLTQRPRNDP